MTISLWESLTARFVAGLHHLWPMRMKIFQRKPFGTKRHKAEILCLNCAVTSSVFQNCQEVTAGGSCILLLDSPGAGIPQRGDGGVQTCSWLDTALMPEEHLKVSPGAANLPRDSSGILLFSFSLKSCLSETPQEFCTVFF